MGVEVWKNAKGRSGYAAHWRKEFLGSKVETTASAAKAASEGHFERCGDLEYTRMSERVNPDELTLEDALREEDTDVNSPDLLDEFCKTKAPNMLRRQELCGELQSRSLRISRLLQILQQHKKKQLKERADALESKKMENEELTLENRLLRERITKLEGMADERESKLSFADFTVTKFDRMYAAVSSENAALRKLIERRGLGSPLRMPTPPPTPPPPRPPSVGRMPSKQKKAWEDLPPPASPDQLSPREASPTISFLERSYAEMKALRTPSPQHIDPFPTRAVQMGADAGLAQEEEELNEWIVHEATQIGADAGLVQEEINELIGHAQEMADDVLMEQPGSTTNMDAQRNIAAAQMLNIIMAVKGADATAIEPAVDQQQQQQHQQQLARGRRTSPAVAPPAPAKQKGADATATGKKRRGADAAIDQQQQAPNIQLPPPSPTKNRADLDRFALASLRRTQPNRLVKYQPAKKIDIKWRTREPPVPLGPPAAKRSVSVAPRVWANVAPMATPLAAPAPTGRPAGADARPNHSICATCGHVLGLTRTKETTKIKGFEKDSVADAVVCNGCNAAFHRDAKLTCCPTRLLQWLKKGRMQVVGDLPALTIDESAGSQEMEEEDMDHGNDAQEDGADAAKKS
ncbi:hypothetical protein niasHT_028481 [Heterodera trifolii]|uniref:Uncharacterized protein n=1 Tax=Heterodera trifolii TaxID=157864 RepID=A0ABD2KRF1_9BILA